jgi:hypothetical protein
MNRESSVRPGDHRPARDAGTPGGRLVPRDLSRSATAATRGHSTAIYYLLEGGDCSHWHRVTDAVPRSGTGMAGGPLALTLSSRMAAMPESHRLGMNLAAGERPQLVVPGQLLADPRPRSGPGHSSAAPWLRASSFRASRWRHPTGGPRPIEGCTAQAQKAKGDQHLPRVIQNPNRRRWSAAAAGLVSGIRNFSDSQNCI